MENLILKTQVTETKEAFENGHKFGLTWLPYLLKIFNRDDYQLHCQEADFVKNQWIKMAIEYADSITSGCSFMVKDVEYRKTVSEILNQSQRLEGWVGDFLQQIKLSPSDIPKKSNRLETGWECSKCGHGLNGNELGYSMINIGEPLCFDHLQEELFCA